MHVRVVRLESGDFEVTTPSRRVVVNEVHIDGGVLRGLIKDVELEALAVTVLTMKRGSVSTTVCIIWTIRSVLEEKLGELKKLERAVRRLEEVVDALSVVALAKPEQKEEEDGRAEAPRGPEPHPLRMTF
jgi:hypothetical protein